MKQKGRSAIAVISLFFIFISAPRLMAAEDNAKPVPRIYDESADGFEQIADAVAAAKRDGKRVLLDFGYNRCVWCQRLHALFGSDKAIAGVLKTNYVVAYIDWSKGATDGGGHNTEVDTKYEARCVQGVPSLVVLDSDGSRLTTKDTGELEEADHHNPQKVLAFLKEWAPKR